MWSKKGVVCTPRSSHWLRAMCACCIICSWMYKQQLFILCIYYSAFHLGAFRFRESEQKVVGGTHSFHIVDTHIYFALIITMSQFGHLKRTLF